MTEHQNKQFLTQGFSLPQVMDSIFLLFEKVETKHGWFLVSHALAYVTAAKSGVSETEVEDLISLDDKVLDDIYQVSKI